MNLKKIKNTDWLEPETDRELFKHCNHGNAATSQRHFDEHAKPLLLAHGVLEIRID